MALVTQAEIEARLEFTMSADQLRMANAAIESLSIQALHITGLPATTTDATCPKWIKQIVLGALELHIRNPEGFSFSRAGEESVGWNSATPRGLQFTAEQEAKLKKGTRMSSSGISSISTVSWSTGANRSHCAGCDWVTRSHGYTCRCW